MARRYVFVYDTRDGSFPERWAQPGKGDDPDQPPEEDINGWTSDGDHGFDARKGALRAGYTASHFEVEEMHATSWASVARNYGGMRR